MIFNTYATQFINDFKCIKPSYRTKLQMDNNEIQFTCVQEEEMSDSDEESAEVDDKQTDDNYHVAINAVNH